MASGVCVHAGHSSLCITPEPEPELGCKVNKIRVQSWTWCVELGLLAARLLAALSTVQIKKLLFAFIEQEGRVWNLTGARGRQLPALGARRLPNRGGAAAVPRCAPWRPWRSGDSVPDPLSRIRTLAIPVLHSGGKQRPSLPARGARWDGPWASTREGLTPRDARARPLRVSRATRTLG